jgi:DnaJ-class molecular chaperone
MGDDLDNGDRGDIHVHVKVTETKGFAIDQLLVANDLIYIEEIEINLYELYYGKEYDIEFFNGTNLSGIVHFDINKPLICTIEGRGLLSSEKGEELTRGNVYIYFRLRLPEKIEVENDKDIQKFLNKYLNNN